MDEKLFHTSDLAVTLPLFGSINLLTFIHSFLRYCTNKNLGQTDRQLKNKMPPSPNDRSIKMERL